MIRIDDVLKILGATRFDFRDLLIRKSEIFKRYHIVLVSSSWFWESLTLFSFFSKVLLFCVPLHLVIPWMSTALPHALTLLWGMISKVAGDVDDYLLTVYLFSNVSAVHQKVKVSILTSLFLWRVKLILLICFGRLNFQQCHLVQRTFLLQSFF